MSCYSYIMCLNGNGDKCLKSILLSFKALLLLVLSQKSCKCFPGSSFCRQSLVTATAQLTDEVFPSLAPARDSERDEGITDILVMGKHQYE